MARENVEVMVDHFTAVNERDFERSMSHYDEDVEIVVHPDAYLIAGAIVGLEAVGRYFGDWFATFEPGYRFDITETRDVGDQVVLIVTHHGRGRSSGVEVTHEAGYLYTLRNGKIIRGELFATGAEALAAAGLND
jgi:ketosteroid isomerase-like protein